MLYRSLLAIAVLSLPLAGCLLPSVGGTVTLAPTVAVGPRGTDSCMVRRSQLVRHVTPFFEAVPIYSGPCRHSDGRTTTVTVSFEDRAYLLDSLPAFNALVDRHPPVPIDSARALQYAVVALELSGVLPPRPRVITRWRDLPQQVVGLWEGPPAFVIPELLAPGFTVFVFLRMQHRTRGFVIQVAPDAHVALRMAGYF